MPSIADQVSTIEHDLTAALACIDTLTAEKAAFMSANSSLLAENTILIAQNNDMKHFVDDTRTMVEQIAASALELLRSSRRQVGPVVKIVDKPFLVPGPDGVTPVVYDPKASLVLDIKGFLGGDEQPTEAQTEVAEIMTGDSGDEQPHETVFETMCADAHVEAMEEARRTHAPVGFTHCTECPNPLACDGVCHKVIETEVDGLLAEMGETVTPAKRANLIAATEAHARARMPVNEFAPRSLEPLRVEHDEDDLPIFLRRDTQFDPRPSAVIQGAVFG